MSSVSGRYLRVAVLLLGSALASVVFPVGAASASASVGRLTLTHAGLTSPLNSGGSSTPYGVDLPANASCPGDTQHDGYHVFSYLVPQGVSPTTVSFKTGVPSKYFGFISYGAYWGAINTAPQTGQIVSVPPEFVWSRLTGADLFPAGVDTARWEGGIACADVEGKVTKYWNVEVQFAASESDPGGFIWSATAPVHGHGSAAGLAIGLPIAVGGVVCALFLWLTRERTLSKRHSTPKVAAET